MRWLIGTVIGAVLCNSAVSAEPLDAAALDMLSPEARIAIQDNYVNAKMPKVLAISHNGHYAWHVDVKEEETLEDVKRIAIEKCELLSHSTCFVAAVDNDTADFSHDSIYRITPSGPVDYRFIPLIRRSILDDKIKEYSQRPQHKALALSINGAWATSWNADSVEIAEAKALENCQKSGKSCFIYESDRVVSAKLATALDGSVVSHATPQPAPVPVADNHQQSDCAEAKLRLFAEDKCFHYTETRTLGGGYNGNFPVLTVSGRHETLGYRVTKITAPMGSSSVHADNIDQRAAAILQFATPADGKAAPPMVSGDTTYMPYMKNREQCFGFYKTGAPKAGGYDAVYLGFFCDARRSEAMAEQDVTSLLAAVAPRD